ncbi:MAG: hypothetical protein WB502_08195 [Thermoactinomyces sp.]
MAQNKVIDQLINKAIPGRTTKGKSIQYELSGGFEQALKDFEKLQPNIIKNTPELKIGTLNDGRTAIVRKKSSGNVPTLEFQEGKKKLKFRYSQ